MTTQQEFLRNAAAELDLTQKELAARMAAPWETFRKWLMPNDSSSCREMPEIAWQLVREILEHEKLKKKVVKRSLDLIQRGCGVKLGLVKH